MSTIDPGSPTNDEGLAILAKKTDAHPAGLISEAPVDPRGLGSAVRVRAAGGARRVRHRFFWTRWHPRGRGRGCGHQQLGARQRVKHGTPPFDHGPFAGSSVGEVRWRTTLFRGNDRL